MPMKKIMFIIAMLITIIQVKAVSQSCQITHESSDATPLITLTVSQQSKNKPDIFNKTNLVAWCIVPFDATKRSPEERATMIHNLGLKKIAYDWRQEHVKDFEREIIAYKNNNLEFFAFWSWHPNMEPLIRKHQIKPQIWQTCPSPEGETSETRIALAAKQLQRLYDVCNKLNLKLGLYNHGGWGGQPDNLIAICKYMRKQNNTTNIGIVYNLHHAHNQLNQFQKSLNEMKPYLLCLNLNGMNTKPNPKILPVGQGQHDQRLLQIIKDSKYAGPIGILDHRSNLDAEKSLKQNLDGLSKLTKTLK